MQNKQYLCKIYRSGTYMGVLPYVVTDVEFDEEINKAGSAITVKLGTDLTGAGIGVSVDYLVTNAGNHITDDLGNRIITRKDYLFSSVPIDLGNQIDVYLYYSGAPNGTRIFTGLISSWEADDVEATITLNALSWGVQLNNYPIEVLPGTTILDCTTYTTSDQLFGYTDDSVDNMKYAHQTFQVASATSILSVSIVLNLDPSIGVPIGAGLGFYSGTPTGTHVQLGTAARFITNTVAGLVTFVLTEPVPVSASTTYYWQLNLSSDSTKYAYIGRSAASTTPTGNAIAYSYQSGYTTPSGDFAFSLQTATGSLGNQFNSYDPGDIIVALLDQFTNAGGLVDSSTTSVQSTGTLVSYTFKDNTVLDGINKCLELAPPNWYWYVDVGTNVLYFDQFSLNPDHNFVKGLQVSELTVKYTLEQIKNRIIFTGGDDPGNPGTNITSKQSNSGSIGKYGQWMEFDNDSRVTLQATADVIGQNTLGENAQPSFQTTCTVLATKYDVETLKIGQMVGFDNFNALTNSLILQIVAIHRTPDVATLTLATLPPAQTHRIEDIKRNLDNLATANNPAQ